MNCASCAWRLLVATFFLYTLLWHKQQTDSPFQYSVILLFLLVINKMFHLPLSPQQSRLLISSKLDYIEVTNINLRIVHKYSPLKEASTLWTKKSLHKYPVILNFQLLNSRGKKHLKICNYFTKSSQSKVTYEYHNQISK